MSKEATDLILGLAALEQAEYRAAHNKLPAAPSPAAGRNSEGAVRKGSQAVSSGQTPASPTVPLGEAGPHSSDADAVGAPASEGAPEVLVDVPDDSPSYQDAYEWGTVKVTVTRPTWAPVDSGTGDLLDLLAIDGPLRADDWPFFLSVLKEAADKNDGVIDQNHTRPRLHGEIRPARIGAMFRRACREGLIRPAGYTVTANSSSGNVGRPAKSYVWLGATS